MKPLLVVDAPKRWPLEIPGTDLVSSSAYLSDPELAAGPGRKVFNLCRSFRYQAAGYYVSLLAEARGHRPLPSVGAIQDLRMASVIRVVSQDLDAMIQTSLRTIRGEAFELSVYFGRNMAAKYDRLALSLFNAFPAPLVRARFERNGTWRLAGVRILGLGDVPESHRPFVIEQAGRYLRRVPSRRGGATPTRYDLAILHDPAESMPPSNAAAFEKMIAAGEACGIRCELVERDAYGRLAEYDALFIRETTQVNHHTYRFARRAQAEGLVVIDDPRSIMRCTNKVYLAETLARHRVPTPRTVILTKDRAAEALETLGYPCVLKQPDSAFSAGVVRLDSPEEATSQLAKRFEGTDLLVAQEYVPTSFDWRIGVLGGDALFACRYGMAASHWQIVKRDADGVHEGDSECVPIEAAPVDVVKAATRAAALMGDGLYGVDVKVVRGRPLVIEVNDNPNLDAGVEDEVLGDDLYRRLMQHFLRRLETR